MKDISRQVDLLNTLDATATDCARLKCCRTLDAVLCVKARCHSGVDRGVHAHHAVTASVVAGLKFVVVVCKRRRWQPYRRKQCHDSIRQAVVRGRCSRPPRDSFGQHSKLPCLGRLGNHFSEDNVASRTSDRSSSHATVAPELKVKVPVGAFCFTQLEHRVNTAVLSSETQRGLTVPGGPRNAQSAERRNDVCVYTCVWCMC
jgi:hypothetical protein